MTGFLFDENLPRRLSFTPSLPVIHSTALGRSASDETIWNHARDRALVIVSKDADFSEHILVSSAPPWVVHLCFGNLRRSQFHPLLAKMWPRIEALLPAHKLISVYANRIETVAD